MKNGGLCARKKEPGHKGTGDGDLEPLVSEYCANEQE